MNLVESDTQIFVTALNKLDNPRARELVKWFASEDGVKHIINLEDEKEVLRQVGEKMMKFADIFKDENVKLKKELNDSEVAHIMIKQYYKSIINEINELLNSGDTGFDIKHKLKIILDKLESDK